MSYRVVTPPSTLPITVVEAKANGRIDTEADDDLIQLYIEAALAYAEKYCSQAFEPQTIEVSLDAFPDAEIELPLGPVVSVTSVIYIDADGFDATVDSGDYVVDTASRDGWVVPVSGLSWPTPMETVNAVRVRYVAGTGTPRDVKQAILLLTESFYENRAAVGKDGVNEIPFGARAILDMNRRMFV